MAFKVSKEVQVGAFALIAGASLYFGFNFLKGTDFLSSNNKYFVVYDDVGGLVVSNPVMVNGLSIGRVQDIELIQGQKDRIIVTLEIDHNVKLYKGTAAFLGSTGLLGDKMVDLKIPAPNGVVVADKDTIGSGKTEDLMAKVTAKAEPLIANMDSLSRELKVMVRGFHKTREILNATLTNTTKATEQANLLVAENRPALRRIATNTAQLTASLQQTQKGIDGLLHQFSSLADTLQDARIAQTVHTLNRTVEELNGIVSDVNAGKGSLGKLTKNDSLYSNLNRSSEDLDALLQDMKAHPSRYVHFSVFGKKDK